MKWAIYASKDTTPRSSSRELKRFETPDEANGAALATAYVGELLQQGYEITDVSQVDATGYPVQTKQRHQR